MRKLKPKHIPKILRRNFSVARITIADNISTRSTNHLWAFNNPMEIRDNILVVARSAQMSVGISAFDDLMHNITKLCINNNFLDIFWGWKFIIKSANQMVCGFDVVACNITGLPLPPVPSWDKQLAELEKQP